MNRLTLFTALALTAALAVILAVIAVISPAAARHAVQFMLQDVDPGSWVDVLRSRILAV